MWLRRGRGIGDGCEEDMPAEYNGELATCAVTCGFVSIFSAPRAVLSV